MSPRVQFYPHCVGLGQNHSWPEITYSRRMGQEHIFIMWMCVPYYLSVLLSCAGQTPAWPAGATGQQPGRCSPVSSNHAVFRGNSKQSDNNKQSELLPINYPAARDAEGRAGTVLLYMERDEDGGEAISPVLARLSPHRPRLACTPPPW